jgi:malate dehydrogenase (oxaloacetate-decarboxylating)
MTTDDIGPYSNYRLTVRLALLNKPGIFAKVAGLLAEEGANLGAVDIVSANAERMIRDITFDVQNEAHGERVLERLEALPEVNVLSASDRIFLLHLGGKIRVQSKVPVNTRNVLSMIYTPGWGVSARPSRKTHRKPMPSRSRAIAWPSSPTGLRYWVWAISVPPPHFR